MIRSISPDELSLTRYPAQEFFAESKIAGILNFDHFCETWGNLIELDIACIMIYFDSHNEPLGIIGGTLTPCTMTGDKIAMESFWWIARHLRGGTAGLNLLRRWERWAQENSAVRIYVGNLWSLNSGAMQTLYKRLGYEPLEIHYVKQLP